jgi:TolB-like protein/cytochrome c-type biogenesis protein CcmH/NrfG
MTDLIQRLRERKLVQWALAYAAGAFALLQGLDIVAQRFGWPESIERVLIIALAVGFFVTLILAWYHGERGAQRASGTELLLLALLLLIGGGLLWHFAPPQNAPGRAPSADTPATTPPTSIPAAAGAHVDQKSIAVLPFDNLSDEKANAYFAEGIQDEILTRLAKVGALRVISRTSTMQYAGKPGNLSEIARQLGVMNIVEGSVQKAANRVRINVQLIRADGDKHLWAETYDRNLDDIFGVQGEVARAIADRLGAALAGDARAEIAAVPTRNAVAYDAYLRGVALYRQASENSAFIASTRAFEQAVEADPDFSQAWALLARNGSILIFFGGDASRARREETLHALETAERLHPGTLETLSARAYYVYRVLRDFDGARRRFEELHERWPNEAEVLEALSYVLARQGHTEEAVARLDDALKLDPLNVRLLRFRALEAMCQRRFGEASKVLARLLAIAPGDAQARQLQGVVLLAQGDLVGAAPVLDHAPQSVAADEGQYVSFMRQRHEYAAAIDILERLLLQPDANALFTDIVGTRLDLADLQRLAGSRPEALDNYRQVRAALLVQIEGQADNASLFLLLAQAEAGLGNEAAALAAIDKAMQLVPESQDAMGGPTFTECHARLLARFGHRDEAIVALRHLLDIPYIGVTSLGALTPADLRLDPDFDNLRDDPRFQALANPDGKGSEGATHE